VRIALIGNCQIESMQACLRVLLPDAELAMHHSWNLRERFGNVTRLQETLSGFDAVLAHRFYDIPQMDFDALKGLPTIIEFPTINFSSFHPDCVYLVDADSKKIVRSVVGDYNSALIAYSYANGLSLENCLSAFRDEIYQHVGYYAAWEKAVYALDAEFQRCGFAANTYIPKWVSERPFVHSLNHPKLFAVYDLVVAALDRAKLPYRYVADIEEFAADPLLKYAGWPVYNEIAQFFGVKGSYYFRGDLINDGSQYIFSLGEFIEQSYSMYKRAGVRGFSNELFLAWDEIGLLNLIKS